MNDVPKYPKRPSGSPPARLGEKSWVKLLESASGSPIERGVKGHTAYLLIDCSSSMGGDKIRQAREGATGFIATSAQKGYKVGIISFASIAKHLLEPEGHLTRKQSLLKNIEPGGTTNMAAAIGLGIEKLHKQPGFRVLCIVTDGMPDDVPDALAAASTAKRAGIEILVIGTDDADHAFLERLATRKDLAQKVATHELTAGITSAARLLKGGPGDAE